MASQSLISDRFFPVSVSQLTVLKNSFHLLVVPGLSAFPRLSPNNEEQIYQSGSSFLLTCEATKDIEWKLPVLSVKYRFKWQKV